MFAEMSRMERALSEEEAGIYQFWCLKACGLCRYKIFTRREENFYGKILYCQLCLYR